MKKLIPLLLALCLLLTPMMAKVSADEKNKTGIPDPLPQVTGPDERFLAGSVPAASALLDGIQAPVHALILSMLEHEQNYDINSDYFVWVSLYYTLSMNGEADDRAQLTPTELLLPSEAVNDFARALFAQLDNLPAIPSQLTEFVTYDSDTDTYQLALGDFAQTQLQFGELKHQANGSCLLSGTLIALDDNSPLCLFQITLLESDNMFGFSILDVYLQ